MYMLVSRCIKSACNLLILAHAFIVAKARDLLTSARLTWVEIKGIFHCALDMKWYYIFKKNFYNINFDESLIRVQ